MRDFSTKEILKVMDTKSYPVFSGRKYDLTLVAVRSKDSVSGEFDDKLYILYYIPMTGLKLHSESFAITTDPGKHWLLNPLNKNGTLIMVPGRYPQAYKLGYHNRSKGKKKMYLALEQHKPMTYVRDNNRDYKLDFSLIKDVANHIYGNFKTNLHRASMWRKTLIVGKYSAGCQVIASPYEYDRVMELANLQRESGFGGTYTYVLLEENDFYDH